jgi:hypothetical protein
MGTMTGVHFPEVKGTFLFTTTFTPALKPSQPIYFWFSISGKSLLIFASTVILSRGPAG